MKRLAPDLFDRRFGDLLELGRARLPSLAPEWTDHNAHDPGITLMELLAWVTEAQLYAVSRRPRRDERAAYASLVGLVPRGTQGATGLLWSDRHDPDSPFATFVRSAVIGEDAVINVVNAENPTFRPARKLLWAPGRITKLETRSASGSTIDHTVTNERGGPPFAPFGEKPGRRDVLALTFECRDKAGLFGSDRTKAMGALWAIGVSATNTTADEDGHRHTGITATLVTDTERFDVKVASDSTRGFLATGALLLDLDSVTSSPSRFTIELRSPNGFARTPRVQRIDPNVVPIRQGRVISQELHAAKGEPDFNFLLNVPGLRFASGAEPAVVDVADATGVKTWSRRDRLADHGPDDEVYELDTASGKITFGNGVNGRVPPADAQVLVTYAVSDGEAGRVARNRRWKVTGFEGVFGVNPDPIEGGAPASGWLAERREARRLAREDHALVSAEDIETAAKAIPLLDVARAWVAQPDPSAPRTGVVTLVVMRAGGNETARWLETIRCRLAPRMPLGSRLAVAAPRYVEFSIHAVLETERGRNPAVVRDAIQKELKTRLDPIERPTGVPVTRRDVAAWMRATEGVARIVEVRLRRTDSRRGDGDIAVPRNGLPRWGSDRSELEVRRPQ